jgi:uncharacterized damage-inducible protein DinB
MTIFMTKIDIRRLFSYTEWANHEVLDAAESLNEEQMHRDFQSGQHSILETLVHMLGAEWIWLERWEGIQHARFAELQGPFKMEGASLASVRTAWSDLELYRTRWLGGLSEEAVHANVKYKNLRGDEFSQPLIDQIQHVINHATHHRGQVVGFLRALGMKPPTTDMIHYFRTKA